MCLALGGLGVSILILRDTAANHVDAETKCLCFDYIAKLQKVKTEAW